MTERTAVQDAAPEAAIAKYLTFGLAEEEYGIEILRVREIIGMMDITRVPRTPDFIKGIVNLRGKIIPVMDLRTKFGMPPAEHTAATCIIVVHLGDMEMGIVVDSVSEVLDISEDAVEETPSFGADVDTQFILGVGKADEQVIILLDIDRVLTGAEIESLANAQSPNR